MTYTKLSKIIDIVFLLINFDNAIKSDISGYGKSRTSFSYIFGESKK